MQREQAAQAPSPKEYLSTLLHQARAARQPSPDQPSPPPAPSFSPSAKFYPRPVNALPSQPVGVWQHWELAPGVELHVKVDVADKQRGLIERLLWVARTRDPNPR